MVNRKICGVYKIENSISGKSYIGSSIDVHKREKQHFVQLYKRIHPNAHLQAAYNKYKEGSFIFTLLEECNNLDHKKIERKYIEEYGIDNLYNIVEDTEAGGYEACGIPVILIDLYGNIVENFKNISSMLRFLNLGSTYNKKGINSGSVCLKKYRIVTPDFYRDHLDTIKSWRQTAYKPEPKRKIKVDYRVILPDGTYYINTHKELMVTLGCSAEKIRRMFKTKQYITRKVFFYKKSRLYIQRITDQIFQPIQSIQSIKFRIVKNQSVRYATSIAGISSMLGCEEKKIRGMLTSSHYKKCGKTYYKESGHYIQDINIPLTVLNIETPTP